MEEKAYSEFLASAGKDRRAAEAVNDFLLNNGCVREIQVAKSGYTVSYLLSAKKTLATFVCRKTGIKLRIFPQNLAKYERFLDTLPAKMKKEIAKASVCKRLLNPDDCNPKCVTGYGFIMDGERYQKCRYMAFMPTVTEESLPFILDFLKKELSSS